ncbi:MAG: hypothetical protein R6U25_04105 [Alkalispirochaeta sp.]
MMHITAPSRKTIQSVLVSAGALLLPVGVLSLVLTMPELVTGRARLGSFVAHGALLLVILLVLTSLRTRRYPRATRLTTAMVVGYLIGFAATEAGIQYVYARHFTPRGDIPMVRSLIQLGLGPVGPLADLLTPIIIVVLAVVLGATGMLWVWMARRVAARVPNPHGGLGLLAAAVLLALIIPPSASAFSGPSISRRAVVAWFDDGGLHLRDLTALDATADAASAAAADATDPASADSPTADRDAANATDATEAALNTPDYTFPGIRDRDIYFFAIEAYGYATVSQEEISRELDPHRDRLEEVLADNGYQVVSSYLRSPVAGGFSWLAETTFLTGQWITSQAGFEELYDAELPSLTSFLYDGGYHTFSVRPGTVHGSWPEGWDLFRFEESLVAHDGDFDYAGPWFSYVAITDQYALWQAHSYLTQAIAPEGPAADRPVAAYYQLVSSHTPFNRIPPIIEDWEELGDGSVYEERSQEILTFDNSWSGGTELIEGYTAAISYTMRAITKYVEDELYHDREPILIIFGDHQAQRPIREADAHLSVPIHVASRDADIVERFRSRGFQRGMVSDEAPPHRDMSDFFPLFMEIARDRTSAR